MLFLVDECVDVAVVRGLRSAGHDVRYLPEEKRGLTDDEVLAMAEAEDRVLVTEDKDFGELAIRWNLSVPGVVLIRIDPARRDAKWSRLAAALDRFGDSMVGRYTVVHIDRFRSRPLLSLNQRET